MNCKVKVRNFTKLSYYFNLKFNFLNNKTYKNKKLINGIITIYKFSYKLSEINFTVVSAKIIKKKPNKNVNIFNLL